MSMLEKTIDYLYDILDAFDEVGALQDVILVGSWAELIYEKTGILSDFSPLGKTTDIDFLVTNLRIPKNPVDVIAPAEKRGYIYEEDYMSGCSRLKKDEFTVEFLICQKGDGTKKLPRTHIGVNAQQITHMEIAKKNAMHVTFGKYNVIIPRPEAYILQKMIINDRRGIKKELDQEKIQNLLQHIDVECLDVLYQSLYKKEKKKIDDYIKIHCHLIQVTNGHIVSINL